MGVGVGVGVALRVRVGVGFTSSTTTRDRVSTELESLPTAANAADVESACNESLPAPVATPLLTPSCEIGSTIVACGFG